MEPAESHPALPAQRAADSDREAAADAIRAAGADGRLSFEELEERMTAVYAARTHPELDALLADLHGRQELAPHAQAPTATRIGQISSGPETERTISILGESKRGGFWRPAAESRVLTLLGETTIDLTEADLSRPVTHMRVVTILGQTNIEVPDDINVHVTKTTILADNDVDSPVEPLSGAPELHLKLVSVLGETRVRIRRRRGRRSELYA